MGKKMIKDNDLQFMESERMTDFNDGGGRMTGNVVIDGKINNVFPDVPEMHRVTGNVTLVKVYGAVRAANTDTYYGPSIIISGQPSDPNVSVTLFTTKSQTDERSNAKDYLENYLNRGGRWQGWLYGKQSRGARAIVVWQREDIELPAIDSVWCLVENPDSISKYSQYVRIKRLLDNNLRTFEDDQGQFVRRVLTLELSASIEAEFHGVDPTRFDSAATAGSKCTILRTIVANGVKYYSSSTLVKDQSRGSRLIRVKSIFNQLVPSARAETPIADANAAGDSTALVPSDNGLASLSSSNILSPIVPLYLGSACQPGTLKVIGSGYEITDNGGELIIGNLSIGTINYARGLLKIAPGGANYEGTKQISFKPAGSPKRVMDTSSVKVKPETRGNVYIFTLNTAPTPGSVIISYLAQGKWYDLNDNGAGAAYGADPSFGSATINYTSQIVTITTGALPDVDSVVLVQWASPVNYFNRADFIPSAPALKGTLDIPLTEGTTVIKWTDGKNQLVATVDGTGKLSGDATGTIEPLTGDYTIIPNKTPLAGTVFEFSGNADDGQDIKETIVNNPALGLDGTVSIYLEENILPGALLSFNLATPKMFNESMKKYVGSPGVVTAKMKADGTFDQIVGQYDKNTGVLKIAPVYDTWVPVEAYGFKGGMQIFDGWRYNEPTLCSIPQDGTGYIKVQYKVAIHASAFKTNVTLGSMEFDLTDRFSEQISEGSVRFTYAGKTYIDVGGKLITDINPATGAGKIVGSINYANGWCILNQWNPAEVNQITMQSLLTEIGGQPVSTLTFRVPLCPLRPGSVSLSAVTLDGKQVRIDPDGDSEFVTETAKGRIDYATGVIDVLFGKKVVAAGNENEEWYDPANVDADGNIWQPKPVMADTIRYSAVAYTYLPLDPEILGLDPVRLPTDGRVPVFQDGDVIVISHDGLTPLPAVITAGTAYPVGRTRLSRLQVKDDDSNILPPERYEADLDTGTVVFKSPLDLSGTTGNLTMYHRIEDASLIYDVQISGDLSLQRPLSHDFPEGAVVSAALLTGNLQARVTKLFTQQTWLKNWVDYPEGNPITAQYNSTQYPIRVNNLNAITERWAFIFTDKSNFRIIGEYSGQIGTGSINEDCKPVNPNTGEPYFTIKAAGWGSGWDAGNVFRFNSIGTGFPIWLARTTLMGEGNFDGDLVQLQLRGDVNQSS